LKENTEYKKSAYREKMYSLVIKWKYSGQAQIEFAKNISSGLLLILTLKCCLLFKIQKTVLIELVFILIKETFCFILLDI